QDELFRPRRRARGTTTDIRVARNALDEEPIDESARLHHQLHRAGPVEAFERLARIRGNSPERDGQAALGAAAGRARVRWPKSLERRPAEPERRSRRLG